MPFDIKEFGRRLKQARTAADLTQDALAGLIAAPGKNPRTWISELENGRQESLRAETVVRFAEALGVSADYLLGLVDATAPGAARTRQRRAPGLWKGQIWVSPDFDETDEELIRAFEGADDEDTL